jgi:hypothetical protein
MSNHCGGFMANELNFSFWCGERSVSIAHSDLVWAEWNLVNDRTVFLIQMLVSRNYIDLQTREGHRCIWMLRPWFSYVFLYIFPTIQWLSVFQDSDMSETPAAQTLKDTPVTWRSFGCTVCLRAFHEALLLDAPNESQARLGTRMPIP